VISNGDGKSFFQFLPTLQELRKHLCLVGPLIVYGKVTGQMLSSRQSWLACQLCRIEV